jgi:hypothetical protein
MSKKKLIENPGSPEAIKQGCTCPVLDNEFGRGSGPFWITDGCPLHNLPVPGDENDG